eukprot:gene9204-8287_t
MSWGGEFPGLGVPVPGYRRNYPGPNDPGASPPRYQLPQRAYAAARNDVHSRLLQEMKAYNSKELGAELNAPAPSDVH